MKIEKTTCMAIAAQLTEAAAILIGSGKADTQAAISITYEVFKTYQKSLARDIDDPVWPSPEGSLEIGGFLPGQLKGLLEFVMKAAPGVLAGLPKQLILGDTPIKMPG